MARKGGEDFECKYVEIPCGYGGGEIDCIDVTAFFNKFPRNAETLRDLRALKNSGYISLMDADDEIDDIGVNKKALDYFK